MKYTEINIKEGMPAAADAIKFLQDSVFRYKRDRYECMLIVHGYGSSGKGGVICQKARQWLKAQERGGRIGEVIFGEDFNIFNFNALALKNKYPELKKLLDVCNNGVTVVKL